MTKRKKKPDHVASLRAEFPQNEQDKKRLVDWLRHVAREIAKSKDPKEYVPNPRWRLMR